jgi:hypothetical protein
MYKEKGSTVSVSEGAVWLGKEVLGKEQDGQQHMVLGD